MEDDEKHWIPLDTRRGRLAVAAITAAAGIAAAAFSLWGRARVGSLTAVLDPVEVLLGKTGDRVATALAFNAVILALTGIGLLGGSLLAMSLIRHRAGRHYAQFGVLAALTIIVAGLAKDTLRLTLPASGTTPFWFGTAGDWETALAMLVVSAQVVAWPIAVIGFGMTVGRSWSWSRAQHALSADDVRPPLALTRRDAPEPTGGAVPRQSRNTSWARGFNVPESEDVLARLQASEPVVGVCLSGGGVRAGSLALGVLQAPAMREKLLGADFVVSVSGGGYIAGAFQQALSDAEHPDAGDWAVVRDPASVLMPGTAEEDFVRRHASYLANTPGQLVHALARIAAHLVITMALVFAPAVAVGVALGLLYRGRITSVNTGSTIAAAVRGALPTSFTWVVIAVAIPLAAAALCALLAWWGVAGKHLRRAAACFSLFALVTAVVTVGIPALIGLAGGIMDGSKTAGQVAATSFWGVLATYAVSLVSIGRVTAARMSKGPSWLHKIASAPGAVLNMLLVVLVLVVATAAWLLLAGGAAAATIDSVQAGDLSVPIGSAVSAVLIVLFAVVIGGFVDETRLSLHPFYRARLASAFAVRRVSRSGVDVAVAYDPETRTSLSKYGRRPVDGERKATFPQVIFAASATIGGARTPAGNNRVSYTFSGDWIGGPEVGYVRAEALERISPKHIERDLTVQGAVAISGGAISASGGGQGSPWYGTLFALSGVRLGAWLPNPAYAIERYREGIDAEDASRNPRIPRKRRIDCLLKELLGPHTHNGPLLQVTDGGFYDNLGLIELLRRRCTEIYSVDASGEVNSAPSTLAHAISLAAEELGVRIDWGPKGVWTASAGTADDTSLPKGMDGLRPRLGESPVLVGTVIYPDECGMPGLTGTIRVARASLWPGLPPDVLTYALGHRAFPNDSTADQWFYDDDYRAYTTLGRAMGDLLATAPAPEQDAAAAVYRGSPTSFSPTTHATSPTMSSIRAIETDSAPETIP